MVVDLDLIYHVLINKMFGKINEKQINPDYREVFLYSNITVRSLSSYMFIDFKSLSQNQIINYHVHGVRRFYLFRRTNQ